MPECPGGVLPDGSTQAVPEHPQAGLQGRPSSSPETGMQECPQRGLRECAQAGLQDGHSTGNMIRQDLEAPKHYPCLTLS